MNHDGGLCYRCLVHTHTSRPCCNLQSSLWNSVLFMKNPKWSLSHNSWLHHQTQTSILPWLCPGHTEPLTVWGWVRGIGPTLFRALSFNELSVQGELMWVHGAQHLPGYKPLPGLTGPLKLSRVSRKRSRHKKVIGTPNSPAMIRLTSDISVWVG